jgi:hypothetical protein
MKYEMVGTCDTQQGYGKRKTLVEELTENTDVYRS